MTGEDDADARLLRALAVFTGCVAIAWGVTLGVRPALAFGVAQLSVLAALALYPRLALRGVTVRRTMSGAACEEDVVRVRFDVESRTPLPLLGPEVVDRFVPDKVPVRRAVIHPWLPPWTGVVARYDGRCYTRRGEYAIGPETVRVRCPLGLFSAERTGPAPAPLVVYPAIETLPALLLAGASRTSAAAAGALREAGEGGVVLGVREYRPGDALRRIHWPTTARRGRLSIVEHEREVARGVVLFLDLSRAALRGLGRQSTLETAVRAYAAIASHAVGRGDRVALHAHGVHLPLAGGRPQLERVLDVLARVRPDADEPLPDLVRSRWSDLRPGQVVWLVVGDVEKDGPAVADVCGALRARGCRVAVLLLDPATFRRIFGAPAAGPLLGDVANACLAQGATVHVAAAGDALAETLAEPWLGRRVVRVTREMLS